MILDKQHDLDAFRGAIRTWLADVVPSDWPSHMATEDHAALETFQRWWMAERNEVRLGVPHWPVEHGGAGLSLTRQIILADGLGKANAPTTQMYIVSLNHIPGTLIPSGTEEQKRKDLPGIPNGDVWSQGLGGQRFGLGADDTNDSPMSEYLTSFGGAIAAGSNGIMRNIIAERGFGMARG